MTWQGRDKKLFKRRHQMRVHGTSVRRLLDVVIAKAKSIKKGDIERESSSA